MNGEWCRKMIGTVDKERSRVEVGESTAWNNNGTLLRWVSSFTRGGMAMRGSSEECGGRSRLILVP